jgi:hypothetical protein
MLLQVWKWTLKAEAPSRSLLSQGSRDPLLIAANYTVFLLLMHASGPAALLAGIGLAALAASGHAGLDAQVVASSLEIFSKSDFAIRDEIGGAYSIKVVPLRDFLIEPCNLSNPRA